MFNSVFEKQIIFKTEISGAAKVNRIIKETHNNEIPILGSSRANGSFIPSVLGENFYNYGIDGTSSNVWLVLLKQELKKKKSNPVILNFDLEGFQNSIGAIDNYIPNGENREIKLLTKKNNVDLPQGLFKYYGSIQNYLKFYINERYMVSKKIDNGGAFEINNITKSKFRKLVSKRENTKNSFSVFDSLFSKYVNTIKSTEREIVIVIAPYHSSYFTSFTNYPVALDYIKMLDEIVNCTVINHGKLAINDEFFANTTHLNYKGALKFSEILKVDLGKLGY